MAVAPRFPVDGPRPIPPRYRLLDVATIVEEPSLRWQSGVAVWGYPSDLPQAFDPCSTGTFRTKDAGTAPLLPEFEAFELYVPITCTARGLHDEADFEARALAIFAARESAAVEREFAFGEVMVTNPYLTDANVDVLAAAAVQSGQDGLGYLAQAIGATFQAGMIHATPAVVNAAWAEHYLHRESNQLLTTGGIPVVQGYGYAGAIPSGQGAPGATQDWVFATGPVEVRRGNPILVPGTLAEALDRAQNTITFRVERSYLVTWDTALQSAVLIDWAA